MKAVSLKQYFVSFSGYNNRQKKLTSAFSKNKENFGEQGWRSGESTRLPPMWPRFDCRIRHHIHVRSTKLESCLLVGYRVYFKYWKAPLPPPPPLNWRSHPLNAQK